MITDSAAHVVPTQPVGGETAALLLTAGTSPPDHERSTPVLAPFLQQSTMLDRLAVPVSTLVILVKVTMLDVILQPHRLELLIYKNKRKFYAFPCQILLTLFVKEIGTRFVQSVAAIVQGR